jgi:D-psicose/D-tagatose/L-ribulose 3-epimerase
MNLFTWTAAMHEGMEETLTFLQKTGFDFVEMPIGDVEATADVLAKWERIGQQASSLGLGVQTCAILPPDLSLVSSDSAQRQAGVNHLKALVDCSAAAGSTILMGPLYAGFCVFTGKPATEQEWTWSVTAMREVAEYAETKGVVLAIEYLNRFEIYLLTCADEVVRYVEAVDHSNCRIAFDTFHANLEEKKIGEAIRKVAPYLVHVQISENDRSTPGQGHIDFGEVFTALQDVDYNGPIAIEAFGINPPDLAAATHIFRPMFESPEQLATDGLAFIQGQMNDPERQPVAAERIGR